jgi:DNA topoisomerase-3
LRVVITEKPSVARDIARALGVKSSGDGYIYSSDVVITWCVGHLAELVDPAAYRPEWKRWSFDTLPMLPEKFQLRPRKGVVDRFKVVKRLLKDKRFTTVVNACDAGREGELIFRNVYDLAGCQLPIQRLWIASMTETAIRKGWENVSDGTSFEALGAAARCRSEADWLVGLNATRAMTVMGRKGGDSELLSVGRVQTPTLAMMVRRDLEIANFVPEKFFRVGAQFSLEGGEERWSAYWFDPSAKDKPEKGAKGAEKQTPKAERIEKKEIAEAIAAAALGSPGSIVKATSKKKNEKAPLLYDLTSLQRRANSRYGLSAARTLEIAQTLYEKAKVITYPRTDSCFLTPDQTPSLVGLVKQLSTVSEYAVHARSLLNKELPITKRIVNEKEVGDHHAIIPTGFISSRLDRDQARIFDLVSRRFLAVFSGDAVILNSEVEVAVQPMVSNPDLIEPLHFRSKGRILQVPGWRAIDPPNNKGDSLLPSVKEGDSTTTHKTKVADGATRPPAHYNDASLLRGMETAGKDLGDKELARAMRKAGIGTPATRAAIIQTLIRRSYVGRDGRSLVTSERGRALVGALTVPELLDATLTGQWEAKLSEIADGGGDPVAFMAKIRTLTTRIVAEIQAAPAPTFAVTPPSTKPLGLCPICNEPVHERRAVYSCPSSDCDFVVFKTMAKRPVSATMVRTLLREGQTKVVKGFKSRKGKDFSAAITVGSDGKTTFLFPERKPNTTSSSPPKSPVGQPCPRCRVGVLIRGKAAFGCNQYRNGCNYVIPFE